MELAVPGQDPAVAAVRYWRAACLLAATHSFGFTWPPGGRPQRSRSAGHWGCNPGIAWAVGHLASVWTGRSPFLLIVGTGHATSFVLAHQALRGAWSARRIGWAAAAYCQFAGQPSEFVGLPEVPYLGGELGPAIAVSQAAAAAVRGNQPVVCVIGDGECETPGALAGFAHGQVILDSSPGARWLAVVNANGARMGGSARFDPSSLKRLLLALGYEVLVSDDHAQRASRAAAAAVAASLEARRVVWISVTEKGWPAPESLHDRPFRGHYAHKLGAVDPLARAALVDWISEFLSDDVLDSDGRPAPDVVSTARRATLRLFGSRAAPSSPAAIRDESPRAQMWPAWASPCASVDSVLARRRTAVFSPDEAISNRLQRCLAAGLVREVLAEEVCAAWTWGSVEAGRESALVTYEAFAPLISSLLAQYSKMVHARPSCGRPPLLVLLSSLGWANSPTHQNTDLAATVLARPSPRMYLLCPLGARSAAWRTERLLEEARDAVAVVVCSKQRLLDLADPGGAAVEIRVTGAGSAVATVVAIGDVCVTEAVGAMIAAAQAGVALRVVAAVDLRGLVVPGAWGDGGLGSLEGPTLALAWCAPGHVASWLWRLAGRVFPVLGYGERWGATAWETLRLNRMDRISVLQELAALGVDLPFEQTSSLARDLEQVCREQQPDGVPEFDAPSLSVSSLPVRQRGAPPLRARM